MPLGDSPTTYRSQPSRSLLQINPLRILRYHPVAIEHRDQGCDRALHHCHPTMWSSLFVPVVIERHYLFLQYAIERFGVVLIHIPGVVYRIADGESVCAVVAFQPPSVEHGKVQTTVYRHLLAAGA